MTANGRTQYKELVNDLDMTNDIVYKKDTDYAITINTKRPPQFVNQGGH